MVAAWCGGRPCGVGLANRIPLSFANGTRQMLKRGSRSFRRVSLVVQAVSDSNVHFWTIGNFRLVLLSNIFEGLSGFFENLWVSFGDGRPKQEVNIITAKEGFNQ